MPGDGSEGQRALFFFLILFFIYLQPDAAPRQRFRPGAGGYWEDERQRNFHVLANTTYGDFGPGKPLNLTAFREDDGHHWELLPKVQALSRQQFSNSWRGLDDVAFYQEITGDVRGDFKRSALSVSDASRLNLTALDPRKDYILQYFQRNITENAGELSLSFTDSDDEGVGKTRRLRADISIWAESAPGTGWQTALQGVHFENGAAILTTSSTKFDALPALPHFALDAKSFSAATPIMNRTVAEAWEHAFLRDADLIGIPKCELILWLQPKPLVGNRIYLQMVESELTAPEGAPIGTPPAMSFSAILLSPDCGFVLEAESLNGAKTEVFTKLSNRLLVAFIILLGLQITLLKRQMKKASTPSTRSRIAYPSIVIAALGDGLIMFTMVLLLSLDEASFMLIASAVFLACIHVAFLEVKFVFDLWTLQVGEPQQAEAERERREYLQRRQQAQAQAEAAAQAQAQTQQQQQQAQEQPRPPTASADNTTALQPPSTSPATSSPVSANALPLPVTAPQVTTSDTGASPIPVFLPSDQDDLDPVILPGSLPPSTTTRSTLPIATTLNPALLPPIPTARTTFATTYARFYFTLVLLLMLSLLATSLPRPLRSLYFNTLAFLYFTLWLPQIYRNVLRNCRKALTWEYVLGSTLCRAVPVLYWYFVPGNLLAVKTSPRTAWVLMGWLALQVGMLGSQRVLGGRWFLLGRGASWLPKAWEYHPLLVEGGEGADMESAGGEEALLAGPGPGPGSGGGGGDGGGASASKKRDGEMSVTLLASAGEAKEALDESHGVAPGMRRRVFDCAICMNEIDVPVEKRDVDGESTGKGKGLLAGTATGAGFGLGFERASYMVTPCRHIFHAECLEGWMGLRLVCPVCREELPPL